MTNYTAENFARVRFAIDSDDLCWVRWGEGDYPWCSKYKDSVSDNEMASRGCAPVYENPYTPDALYAAWEGAEVPEVGELTVEGTVTVIKNFDDMLSFAINKEGDDFCSNERIIYRPPEPDTKSVRVKELMQVMSDECVGLSERMTQRLAEALVERGVKLCDD